MKTILLTAIGFLFGTMALAMPPHPDPFRVSIGNYDSIWVMEVQAREVPGYSGIIPCWVGATVTIADPNNVEALRNAVNDYYQNQGRGLDPLYPVLPDNKGEWRWATLTTCSTCIGRLRPSGSRPLYDLPPVEMANQLLPTGVALTSLIEEIINGQDDDPLDLLNGAVTIDYWPVRCLEQDTTLLIGGRTVPIGIMSNLTFADEFEGATPGGHFPIIQTHKAWIDTATNNHVWIEPGHDRWNAYQVPGFLCQTQIVGSDTFLVPWELGITEDQYDSLYTCGQLWPQVLQPLANAHGLDVSIYNPSRVLVLTYMRTWTDAYGTVFWPHARPGYFQIGIYQGDSFTRDLSAAGVFVHEWAHAAAGFGDDYSSQSGPHNNRNNVMSRGSHNGDGWLPPYFIAPHCVQQGWRERVTANPQPGHYVLRWFSSLTFQNPFPRPIAPEEIWLDCTPGFLCNNGIGFNRAARLTIWYIFPDHWMTRDLIPADGIVGPYSRSMNGDSTLVWPFYNGDVWPWSIDDTTGQYPIRDSLSFGNWTYHQGLNEPIPVGWRVDNIALVFDSTSGDSTIAFDLNFSAPPFFTAQVSNESEACLGEYLRPVVTFINYGGSVINPIITASSLRSDVSLEFVFEYQGTIELNDTVVIMALDSVMIPNDPLLISANVPISFNGPSNTAIDTIQLQLHQAWSSLTFISIPQMATKDNLMVIAADGQLTAFADFQQLWSIPLNQTIELLAIGSTTCTPIPSEQVAYLAGTQLHLIETGTGNQLRQISLDEFPPTAEPAFMIAPVPFTACPLGVWAISGNELAGWSGGNYEDRENFGGQATVRYQLSFSPTHWCFMDDSLFGPRFALTTGDSTVGLLAIVNCYGEQIFTAQQASEYGNGQPISLDRNGDGVAEVSWTYQGPTYRGIATVSYSRELDSLGLGTREFLCTWVSDYLVANSRSSNPVFGTRLILPIYGSSNFSNGVWQDGGGMAVYGADTASRVGVSLYNDALGYGYTVVASGQVIKFFGSDGRAPIPNASTLMVDLESATSTGKLYTIRHSVLQEEFIAIIVRTPDGAYQIICYPTLPGSRGEWSGSFGNAENQGRHQLLGTLPDCLEPDNISATISRHPGEPSLIINWQVCGHLEWPEIYGYHIWQYANSGNDSTEIAYVTAPNFERHGSYLIPLSSLSDRATFCITAEIPDQPSLTDGRWYWGHTAP